MGWALVIASRLANLLTLGSPRELLCTRVHRHGWRVAAPLDAIWLWLTGQDRHTRRAYIWDRRHNGRPR